MKILIACSKHFYGNIPPIKEYLENKGYIISLPNSYDEPLKEERLKSSSLEEHIKWKAEMMRKDESNISPVDALLVLNFDKNGNENYIGGTTFLEIYTAWKLKKDIFLYNPIPNNIFTDELIGMNPKIINKNLEEII